MIDRNPLIDPAEGDKLRHPPTGWMVYVDLLRDGWICYRTFDGDKIKAASKMRLETWREACRLEQPEVVV